VRQRVFLAEALGATLTWSVCWWLGNLPWWGAVAAWLISVGLAYLILRERLRERQEAE
jgi:membrane protein implicated in regulation of membrane protease activity